MRRVPHATGRNPRHRPHGDDRPPHFPVGEGRAPEATADSHSARAEEVDPVVRFGSIRAGGPSGVEDDRDLGIALFHVARDRWLQGGSTHLARRASLLLESACALRPTDVPALEAKAHLLWMLNRTAEARDAFQAGLALEGVNERLQEGAAALAGATGRRDEAVAHLRRAAARSTPTVSTTPAGWPSSTPR